MGEWNMEFILQYDNGTFVPNNIVRAITGVKNEEGTNELSHANIWHSFKLVWNAAMTIEQDANVICSIYKKRKEELIRLGTTKETEKIYSLTNEK